MEKRQLGRSSLKIAPLAFGGNVFGWTVDEKKSFELLDAFVSNGYNMIDTANSYSRWVPGNTGGESETIIGKWQKERGLRNDVIIATKVGSDLGQGHRDISMSHILKAVEDSLRRLRTDYIDLYQTHWDVENIPVEETMEAHARLVTAGKVRWIGASNFSRERLRASLDASSRNNFPRYESVQPLYNLYDREGFEKELEPLCMQEEIGVLTYYSLASGFLTGKYQSEADLAKSQRGSGIRKYLNDRGNRIVNALQKAAGEYGAQPATVALAWLQARPSVTAPIASATDLNQLNSLVRAADLKLSREAIDYLDEASK